MRTVSIDSTTKINYTVTTVLIVNFFVQICMFALFCEYKKQHTEQQ